MKEKGILMIKVVNGGLRGLAIFVHENAIPSSLTQVRYRIFVHENAIPSSAGCL